MVSNSQNPAAFCIPDVDQAWRMSKLVLEEGLKTVIEGFMREQKEIVDANIRFPDFFNKVKKSDSVHRDIKKYAQNVKKKQNPEKRLEDDIEDIVGEAKEF